MAWTRACRRAVNGTLSVRDVRGPVSACVRQVLRLGWVPSDPLEWIDREGQPIPLLDMAPACVKLMAERDQAIILWSEVAARRPRDSAGIQQGVDLTVVKTLLRTCHPEDTVDNTAYDARREGAILCVFQGATTFPERRCRQGIQPWGNCRICGLPSDEYHRFAGCRGVEVACQRRGLLRIDGGGSWS